MIKGLRHTTMDYLHFRYGSSTTCITPETLMVKRDTLSLTPKGVQMVYNRLKNAGKLREGQKKYTMLLKSYVWDQHRGTSRKGK